MRLRKKNRSGAIRHRHRRRKVNCKLITNENVSPRFATISPRATSGLKDCGWKTNQVVKRHRIIQKDHMKEALRKQENYLKEHEKVFVFITRLYNVSSVRRILWSVVSKCRNLRVARDHHIHLLEDTNRKR